MGTESNASGPSEFIASQLRVVAGNYEFARLVLNLMTNQKLRPRADPTRRMEVMNNVALPITSTPSSRSGARAGRVHSETPAIGFIDTQLHDWDVSLRKEGHKTDQVP